jgi:hypothetical protein
MVSYMLCVATAVLVALAVAGCGGSDDEAPQPAPTPAAVVQGPLCDLLPSGDDPGAPATLPGEPAGVVLTWIPVITTFEAAVRAARMGPELDGVTILAPTDDAFNRAFSCARLDDRARTVCADYRASNARIHVIDGVLR